MPGGFVVVIAMITALISRQSTFMITRVRLD